MTLKVFSYGGGVQSTAALVLAAQGQIDYRTFAFANVGDDSEYPATMAYLREIAMPFAEHHGLDLVELHRTKKDGTRETLYGRMMAEGSKSLPIPVRFKEGGKPGMRTCTSDFKIQTISRWLKAQGATRDNPAQTGIGISLDEVTRMRNESGIAWQRLTIR